MQVYNYFTVRSANLLLGAAMLPSVEKDTIALVGYKLLTKHGHLNTWRVCWYQTNFGFANCLSVVKVLL